MEQFPSLMTDSEMTESLQDVSRTASTLSGVLQPTTVDEMKIIFGSSLKRTKVAISPCYGD